MSDILIIPVGYEMTYRLERHVQAFGNTFEEFYQFFFGSYLIWSQDQEVRLSALESFFHYSREFRTWVEGEPELWAQEVQDLDSIFQIIRRDVDRYLLSIYKDIPHSMRVLRLVGYDVVVKTPYSNQAPFHAHHPTPFHVSYQFGH